MAGVVYDINENATLQNYVNQQQQMFQDLETKDDTKSFIITAAVVMFSAIIIILVVKKL